MDFKAIEKLVKLTDESGLTELRIKDKDFSLTLKKEKQQVIASPVVSPMPMAQAPVPAVAQGETAQANETKTNDKIKVIKAPMVGTFYASPGPDKDAFVSVGDKVKKGDVVCILEAMKLMNEIESDVEGKVVKILVSDEDMIEYGQPLIEVEVE